MNQNCPICGNPEGGLSKEPTNGDYCVGKCIHCGDFELSRRLLTILPNFKAQEKDVSAKLSHLVRRASDAGKRLRVTSYLAEAIAKKPLPRPQEQADLLLRWVAENVGGPGELIHIGYFPNGATIGSKSPAGFELIVDHLLEAELLKGEQHKTLDSGDAAVVTPTFSGWERYEKLLMGKIVYRKAFMAMKFDVDSLNSVVDGVFKPSAKRAGFELTKLDDIPKAGLIDDRLRAEIQACDFMVADLSHDNLGAYWEAGFAEGLGKPVIYTCEKSKFESSKTHFDTNHHLTIVWDTAAPEQAGDALTATIRATLPHIAKLSDEDA